MSNWNHRLCDPCWTGLNTQLVVGDEEEADSITYRPPVRNLADPGGVCCRCGDPTTSGIFVRAEPTRYRCCKHDDVEAES
jgi:hypothetical protein